MAINTNVFKRSAVSEWTLERIAQMSAQDIKNLRDNAERLNEPTVVALCTEALGKAKPRPRSGARKAGPKTKARRLIARSKAFEARGVSLDDPRTSWGGVRKLDGAVVLALWADAIQTVDGGCRYLLWAPNLEGSRPWSDKPGGKERLVHCKKALAAGRAEGLLVYGQSQPGLLPEDKARAVHGVDPETVITLEIEEQGQEIWGTWGKRTEAGPMGNG